MEQTHAVVLMSEYLELIHFKSEVMANKIPYGTNNDYYGYGGFFASKDEALKVLSDENGKAMQDLRMALAEVKKLQTEKEQLSLRLPKPPKPAKEITLEDLKKMSYWEFRKWRNS